MAGLKGKFTFKKGAKETGLRSVARPHANTTIKIKGGCVGTIYAPSRFGGDHWTVSMIVVTTEDNAGWRWARLKGAWDTEAEARAFVIANSDLIQNKLELHSIGDFES
jgi:hypothetical protein